MTRINCVPVEELCDIHLLTEYRELPRVFGLARPLLLNEAPEHYTMGGGHVKFFYNKLGYLINRQKQLVTELQYRKYVVTNTDPSSLLTPLHKAWKLDNDWQPSESDILINMNRLQQKFKVMSKLTWTNRQPPLYYHQ